MYQRILVGTDGSPTARRAVDRAVALACSTGARLTIACAGRLDRALAVAQEEAARHARAGIAIEAEGLEGEAASALLDRSELGGFDLLVVGNRGMTGPGRFLLGSVPDKVSHHARCAVLIAHTT